MSKDISEQPVVKGVEAGESLPTEGSLQQIQRDSEAQPLPSQEKVFSVARRVRSRLTNLIACRVQDNLGGEAIKAIEVEVS